MGNPQCKCMHACGLKSFSNINENNTVAKIINSIIVLGKICHVLFFYEMLATVAVKKFYVV